MTQYGDVERKQYDDFKLMSAFHQYLTIPTQKHIKALDPMLKNITSGLLLTAWICWIDIEATGFSK